jgi:hypothetical protein
MRIINITYCSKTKNDCFRDTSNEVTPSELYTGNRIQSFIKKCVDNEADWAIFSDKYGIWGPAIEGQERNKWYDKAPEDVNEDEFKKLLIEFDNRLSSYDKILFYCKSELELDDLYKRLIKESKLKNRITLISNLNQISKKMDKHKHEDNISDDKLMDVFIETNCFVRLAAMKRLAYNWKSQNEQKQFALTLAFIEQFIALTESIEMLLFAMIEKGSNFENSLFSFYKSININEANDSEKYSISCLKKKYSIYESNDDFCKLLAIDIKKLPILPNDREFKESIDIIINILEVYRRDLPLVQSYNSSKHGSLVRLEHNVGQLYIDYLLKIESISQNESKCTITGFTVNEKLLSTLISNAEALSNNFQALWAISKEGYK